MGPASKPGDLPSTGCFPRARTPGEMEPREEQSSLLQAGNVQEGDRERQGTGDALEVPERSNNSFVCLGHKIPDQKKREISVQVTQLLRIRQIRL